MTPRGSAHRQKEMPQFTCHLPSPPKHSQHLIRFSVRLQAWGLKDFRFVVLWGCRSNLSPGLASNRACLGRGGVCWVCLRRTVFSTISKGNSTWIGAEWRLEIDLRC